MNLKLWQYRAPDQPQPIEEKADITASSQVGILGTSYSLGEFMRFGSYGAETPAAALNLYSKSTAVSVPIDKVVKAFGTVKPVLESREDPGNYITDHEILELLQEPSPDYDAALFWEMIATDYLVTKEACLAAIGNINRPPLELQPLSPKDVSPVEGVGGVAGRYIVAGNTLAGEYERERKGRRVRYIRNNLLEFKQIRGYSTRNNSLLRGQSPLVSAAAEARQHILGNEHNIKMLKKGGRLSLAFHFEEDMEADDFEAVRQRVVDNYAGPNGEAIGVTSGGKLNIEELGTNNKDMDYATLLRIAMDSVALQYNVPLPLISNTAATLNNYENAKLALYDDAALPLADKVYSGVGGLILPRFGLDPKIWRITYDILSITTLRERVLNELKTRKDIGIESDNELRGLIAREGYDGGDTIYKPANLVPVGSDKFVDNPTVFRDMPNEEEGPANE